MAVACVGAGTGRVRTIISRAQVTTGIPLPTPHLSRQHGNYTPKLDGSRSPVIPKHVNPPIKISPARTPMMKARETVAQRSLFVLAGGVWTGWRGYGEATVSASSLIDKEAPRLLH